MQPAGNGDPWDELVRLTEPTLEQRALLAGRMRLLDSS
jgi:hypothetical protein